MHQLRKGTLKYPPSKLLKNRCDVTMPSFEVLRNIVLTILGSWAMVNYGLSVNGRPTFPSHNRLYGRHDVSNLAADRIQREPWLRGIRMGAYDPVCPPQPCFPYRSSDLFLAHLEKK